MTSPWQKPFRGMQINKAHPLAKGLVGCWVMNEASGDIVFDLSGNGNHGTNNGADWVADGLDFNGTDDYVDIPKLVTNPTEITIVSKFKVDQTSSEARVFAHNNIEPYISFRLNQGGTANKLQVNILTDAAEHVLIDTTHTLTDYHTIVLTAKENDIAKLYIDGKFITSDNTLTDFTVSDVVLDNNVLGSGRGYSTFFDGIISYTQIYNRALSPEEVAWLNREPYAMFQQPISPASLYYEAAPTGHPWYYERKQ